MSDFEKCHSCCVLTDQTVVCAGPGHWSAAQFYLNYVAGSYAAFHSRQAKANYQQNLISAHYSNKPSFAQRRQGPETINQRQLIFLPNSNASVKLSFASSIHLLHPYIMGADVDYSVAKSSGGLCSGSLFLPMWYQQLTLTAQVSL